MFADKMRMAANKARRDRNILSGVFDENVWNAILSRIKTEAEKGKYAAVIGRNEITGLQTNKEMFFDELIDEGFIIYERDSGTIIVSWVENTASIFEGDMEETF